MVSSKLLKGSYLGMGMFGAGAVGGMMAAGSARNNGISPGNAIMGAAALGGMGYGAYSSRKLIGYGMMRAGHKMGGRAAGFIGPQMGKARLGSSLLNMGLKFSRL